MQEALKGLKVPSEQANFASKEANSPVFKLRKVIAPAVLSALASLGSAACQNQESGDKETDNDTDLGFVFEEQEIPEDFDYDTDNGDADDDGDGLTNAEEAEYGTNPNDPNTDLDRLTDFEEVQTLLDADPSNDRDPRTCDPELIHLAGIPRETALYPIFEGDHVQTEWGPQGGFHIYHATQSWCKDTINQALTYVEDSNGEVVMGNDQYPSLLFNILQFDQKCEVHNDVEVTCGSWQVMYQSHKIPNGLVANTNDERVFGESNEYTLYLQDAELDQSSQGFTTIGPVFTSSPFHLTEADVVYP